MTVTLRHGNCEDIVPTFAPQSVDAIITDIPYGTTACKWDEIIPFPVLWRIVKHVLKPRGVFVTTASQPFTSKLIMSNVDMFRYEWIWIKSLSSNFLHSKNMPLKSHENLVVFSSSPVRHISALGNRMTYNPQNVQPSKRKLTTPNKKGDSEHGIFRQGMKQIAPHGEKYPKSWIDIPNSSNLERGLHPTQKPVALYEYLIKTYTNEGDTVLDFCMGSGTTGVSCVNTGRDFIGVEKELNYFDIASRRIAQAQAARQLELIT